MSIDLVHEIHVSELRSYRGCRRRWNWLFNEDRQPITTPVPLEFGVAFHYAMQVMYNPETWKLDRYALGVRAETAFIEKCKEHRRDFIRKTDQYSLDDDQERDYEEQFKLGVGMVRWYAKNHLPKEKWTPYAVEQKFRVPVLDEYGRQLFCHCARCRAKIEKLPGNIRNELAKECQAAGAEAVGLPVVYEGRVDAIMIDEHGDFWIWDWKTTQRMMSEQSTTDTILETDDQIASYCWAWMRQLGLNIRGFVYVELRKGFPESPTENKVVRLGRSFSVSHNQMTDEQTFRATVMAKDANAYQQGLYSDYLSWLKEAGPRFIEHHKVYKSREALDNVGYEIYLQAKEMIGQPALYRNPGRFTCGWCPFQGPCIDKTAGRDYEYALETLYEVKPRYYELQEPSTDRRY